MTGWTVVKRQSRKPHYCKLPSWRARRREGLAAGSVLRCDECGTEWKLESDEEGRYWAKVYQ